MYSKLLLLLLVLLLLLKTNTFTIRCNDYLLNINNKKDDKPHNYRSPLYHTTFDNVFINTINHNLRAVKKTCNNDRLLLEYNDNVKEIYFDKKKDIDKILDLIRLVGNVSITTISDYNYFESIYSPYYSTKEI